MANVQEVVYVIYDENNNCEQEQKAPPQETAFESEEREIKDQYILSMTFMFSWMNLTVAYFMIQCSSLCDPKINFVMLDSLSTALTYAILFFSTSHMLPSDAFTRKIRKMQILKVSLIIVSLILNAVSLCMYYGNVHFEDLFMVVALCFHVTGYVSGGYHLKSLLDYILDEEDFDQDELFNDDVVSDDDRS